MSWPRHNGPPCSVALHSVSCKSNLPVALFTYSQLWQRTKTTLTSKQLCYLKKHESSFTCKLSCLIYDNQNGPLLCKIIHIAFISAPKTFSTAPMLGTLPIIHTIAHHRSLKSVFDMRPATSKSFPSFPLFHQHHWLDQTATIHSRIKHWSGLVACVTGYLMPTLLFFLALEDGLEI